MYARRKARNASARWPIPRVQGYPRSLCPKTLAINLRSRKKGKEKENGREGKRERTERERERERKEKEKKSAEPIERHRDGTD